MSVLWRLRNPHGGRQELVVNFKDGSSVTSRSLCREPWCAWEGRKGQWEGPSRRKCV